MGSGCLRPCSSVGVEPGFLALKPREEGRVTVPTSIAVFTGKFTVTGSGAAEELGRRGKTLGCGWWVMGGTRRARPKMGELVGPRARGLGWGVNEGGSGSPNLSLALGTAGLPPVK